MFKRLRFLRSFKRYCKRIASRASPFVATPQVRDLGVRHDAAEHEDQEVDVLVLELRDLHHGVLVAVAGGAERRPKALGGRPLVAMQPCHAKSLVGRAGLPVVVADMGSFGLGERKLSRGSGGAIAAAGCCKMVKPGTSCCCCCCCACCCAGMPICNGVALCMPMPPM